MNQYTISWRPVAAAAALMALNVLSADVALAADEDAVPLSLSISHDIRRDSNFAKDDNNKYGETINSTSAGINLNKTYGRQTYSGGLRLTKEQYANNSQLNNDGKDARGSFSTGIASNWLFNAGGSYTEGLNPIQNNVTPDRVEKNLKTYKDGNLSIQYGNGGTWAIVGSYEGSKQSYSSAAQQYQDYKQRTVGLKAIYFSTDILSYSLGTDRTVTSYDSNPTYRKIIDRDLNLSVDYQATGISLLNATVGRRSTSYDPSDLAGSKGWTGSANWVYTPHGIMTYNMSFMRATGTDRLKNNEGPVYVQLDPNDTSSVVQDVLIQRINNNTVTTSLSMGARAALTGKLSSQLSYSVSHFNIDQTQSQDLLINSGPFRPEPSTNYASYGHTLGLSLDYAALRSLSLGCSVQRYTQGKDLYRLQYSGNAVACNARFTLNP